MIISDRKAKNKSRPWTQSTTISSCSEGKPYPVDPLQKWVYVGTLKTNALASISYWHYQRGHGRYAIS